MNISSEWEEKDLKMKKQEQRWQRSTFCSMVTLSVLIVGAFVILRVYYSWDNKSVEVQREGSLVGGYLDVNLGENRAELDDIARFSVEEYNKNEGKHLSFKRLVSAKSKVVAGIKYLLVIEAHGDANMKLCEAEVWLKPWEHLKFLKHFKPHIKGYGDSFKYGQVACVPRRKVVDDMQKQQGGNGQTSVWKHFQHWPGYIYIHLLVTKISEKV